MSLSESPEFRYPGGRGALIGAVAFLATFGVFFLWVGLNAWSALDQIVVGGEYADPMTLKEGLQGLTLSEDPVPGSPIEQVEVHGWKVAGVFLFGAHFVRSEVLLPTGLETSVSPVLDAGFPYVLLLLVPPVALVLAGFLATRHVSGPYDFRYDLGGGTARRYVWNAALPLLFGYMPMALAGLFLFVDTFTPNLLTGLVLAGLVYPVLFGGIGGLLAYLTGDEYESDTENAVLKRVQQGN